MEGHQNWGYLPDPTIPTVNSSTTSFRDIPTKNQEFIPNDKYKENKRLKLILVILIIILLVAIVTLIIFIFLYTQRGKGNVLI